MIEAELFQRHRRRLFGVAYRMLGRASDAEDVVQDAWLRYADARPGDLRTPEAYLTTIVTRLCLDRLKSARATREEYVGTWLPEPVLTDDRVEPESSASLTESLTLAYMVLLETLTPEERAVFVLREVFEYDYDEIAEMLDITAANGRQLFHRAKTRVAERRPRFSVDAGATRALVGRFVSALRAGDGDALTRVLADDVGFWSDGGGKVPAVRHPVAGRDAVVQVLVRIRRAAAALGVSMDTITVDVVEVNHEPGLVMRVAGRLDSVYGLSVEGGAVAAVRIVRNPDKLRFFERQLVEASSSPRPGGDLV